MIKIVPVSVDGGYRWQAVTEDDLIVVAVQPNFGIGGTPCETEADAVRSGKLWIRGALGIPALPTDFSVVHRPELAHTTRCCGKEVVLKDFPMVGSAGGHTTYRWVCPLCGDADNAFFVRESAEEAILEIVMDIATSAMEYPKMTFNVLKYFVNVGVEKIKGKQEG